MKEKIKTWYVLGLWTELMIRQAVEKGVLTAQEAEDILGVGQ